MQSFADKSRTVHDAWSFAPFCSKSFEHPVNPVIASHPCPVPAAKVFTTSFCLVLMADSTRSRGCINICGIVCFQQVLVSPYWWFESFRSRHIHIYNSCIIYIYIIFICTVYMSYFYVSLMAFDALWFVALTFSSDSNNGCFPTQWQPCCQAGEAYLSACEGWRRWAMVLMGTDGGDWINSMVETKKLIPPPHIVDIPCTSKLIQIVILIGNMIRSWNWVGYPILDKLRSSKVWMCALRNVMSSALGVSSHVATEWFRNDPRSLQHRYEWIPWPFALIN